jgi:hypothetical protein
MCGCLLGVFGGFERDLFRAVVAAIACIFFGCARRLPSPRIFGRGSQGAATDAAAWAGRKAEKAAPRGWLHGVRACGRHLHPDGNGWNRSIWPMLSIGEMPVDNVAMSLLQNRVMAAPVQAWHCGWKQVRAEGVRYVVAENAGRARSGGPGMAIRRRHSRRSRGRAGDNAAERQRGRRSDTMMVD